jgi:hypothetical protein
MKLRAVRYLPYGLLPRLSARDPIATCYPIAQGNAGNPSNRRLGGQGDPVPADSRPRQLHSIGSP